jgi:hypothetical protein
MSLYTHKKAKFYCFHKDMLRIYIISYPRLKNKNIPASISDTWWRLGTCVLVSGSCATWSRWWWVPARAAVPHSASAATSCLSYPSVWAPTAQNAACLCAVHGAPVPTTRSNAPYCVKVALPPSPPSCSTCGQVSTAQSFRSGVSP